MFLTERKRAAPRAISDHAEAELLLETYLAQSEEILNTVNNLISNIQTTEDIVNIILDSQRNSLMLLELQAVMAALAINATAVVGAIMGMNLKNGFEESSFAFSVVAGSAIGLGAATFAASLRMIRKVAGKV